MFIDEEVTKVIRFKLKKYDDRIEENDLSAIEDFDLSNKTLSGREKNIDLSFLEMMPNLKRISLQYFKIDNNIVNILNSLEKLTVLELNFCECYFNNKLENKNLLNLSLNCCRINNYLKISLTKNFTIIGENKLNLQFLENKLNTENLYLNNCKIEKFDYIEYFSNLKKLNLDGSIVDQKKELKKLNKKVNISFLDKYLPVG